MIWLWQREGKGMEGEGRRSWEEDVIYPFGHAIYCVYSCKMLFVLWLVFIGRLRTA